MDDSAEIEMTVETLIQIDKLVQLIESPIFTCTVFLASLHVSTQQMLIICFHHRSPPSTSRA